MILCLKETHDTEEVAKYIKIIKLIIDKTKTELKVVKGYLNIKLSHKI